MKEFSCVLLVTLVSVFLSAEFFCVSDGCSPPVNFQMLSVVGAMNDDIHEEKIERDIHEDAFEAGK
jgi:hypothetical protein